ncbi:MAG: LysM peptidoglycan-binding domain-containing protein, partial [Candidatus Methanofastidiosia archaeon]
MKNWINSRSHTVKSGDNLTRIARQHNVPLRKLKARNQWLLKRLGGKKQSGFNFLRPGD